MGTQLRRQFPQSFLDKGITLSEYSSEGVLSMVQRKTKGGGKLRGGENIP